jgi:hypothetical protein
MVRGPSMNHPRVARAWRGIASRQETEMKRLTINHQPRPPLHSDRERALQAALREAVEWALDLASRIAAQYPEEASAVEKVRTFVRARLAGLPVDVDLDDVLITMGILIGAIDRPPEDAAQMHAIGVDAVALPQQRWPTGPALWDAPVAHHCPGAHAVLTRRLPHLHYVA